MTRHILYFVDREPGAVVGDDTQIKEFVLHPIAKRNVLPRFRTHCESAHSAHDFTAATSQGCRAQLSPAAPCALAIAANSASVVDCEYSAVTCVGSMLFTRVRSDPDLRLA